MLELDFIFFPKSMFLFYFFFVSFKKRKEKEGVKRCSNFYFSLLTFQISHIFLPDISIRCALMEYAYI
jgi:hypothetical protein